MKIGEFLDKLANLIEEYYPHLRHSLRGNVEIDEFMRNKIINILKKEDEGGKEK